jgi:hypothetical protein
MEDLTGFAEQWLSVDCPDTPACNGADLSGDERVNLKDLQILAQNWLSE